MDLTYGWLIALLIGWTGILVFLLGVPFCGLVVPALIEILIDTMSRIGQDG